MDSNDNGIERLADHKGKAEYVYLLEHFKKHNLALEPFMDTVEAKDPRFFLGYLTAIKGYDAETAMKYHLEAYKLYDAMIEVGNPEQPHAELMNCPNVKCNKDLGDIGYPPLHADMGIAWRDIECPECGTEWTEEYGYTGHTIKTNFTP